MDDDSKETNEHQQQQQLQPPHGMLTGSYNRNAAALMGPTSTSQAMMPHWLSVGAPSLRQPQQPLGLDGSPSSVPTQQPYMQFGNEQGRSKRKYAPDGIDLSLRLSLPSASDGGGASASRGRPPGPVKKQLNALGGAGTPFIPVIIKVEAGEDIAAKIVGYTHQGPGGVVILSALGAVSSAVLQSSNPNIPSAVVKYEGQYEIVAMSGSFLNTESNGTLTSTDNLSVTLANHNGNIVGGSVAGMLVAGSQVQVVVGIFVPERANLSAGRVENNPETASASASASGVGPGSPDQMYHVRLWPGSNPQ
ncbi:AT-hook motif nuclear-localized protein 13 isoform X2 [Raphanus sativus]|uniref:AT-hook motif nuclear-localized protein n=1 Tax=Raphanus sativus TaxID=3726 RepID=A0A9W3DPN5_RAPSA|nr:AT-hook motif nuclear-localized protein 13 isoform X2 [Raphanus sativus]